jgi:asparagine synthase (glutamine-hydrolysing)
LNLGEDRNRHYCWNVSPFYALPFFRDAMNCPNDQKTRSRLYRRFVGELSETVLDVEYADFGASITSTEYAVKRGVYEVLGRYPRIRDTLVGVVSASPSASGESDVVRELRTRTESVDGVLDGRAIRRVLDGEDGIDEGGYDLLTVVTLAESLAEEA